MSFGFVGSKSGPGTSSGSSDKIRDYIDELIIPDDYANKFIKKEIDTFLDDLKLENNNNYPQAYFYDKNTSKIFSIYYYADDNTVSIACKKKLGIFEQSNNSNYFKVIDSNGKKEDHTYTLYEYKTKYIDKLPNIDKNEIEAKKKEINSEEFKKKPDNEKIEIYKNVIRLYNGYKLKTGITNLITNFNPDQKIYDIPIYPCEKQKGGKRKTKKSKKSKISRRRRTARKIRRR